MENGAREKVVFDVFLAHKNVDKRTVHALADALRQQRLKVWLDEHELRPGLPWQRLMEEGIRASRSGAVLVGADGIGPWEDEEMQALLQFAVKRHKPVIPVLLPGASNEPELPLFLSNRTWVDLHSGLTAEGIGKLIWGITGERPGEHHPSEISISEVTRRDIVDFLTAEGVLWYGRLSEIEFLSRIFPLREMPSTDPRPEFTNAQDDIWQHRINNRDWDDDWIFFDKRFKLLSGDDSVGPQRR